MNLDLTGRTAVVTGSTAGIGLAIARQLARQGASVVVNGRKQERVGEAVDAVRGEQPDAKVTGVVADLATADGVEAFAGQVADADVLVNNLGIFHMQPFDEIDDDAWQKFFDTNVMSGVRMSRRYLPGMLERDWGRIVFISSESGRLIPEEMVHYGMTKTAQLALSRGIAKQTRGTGVTVNAVLPGPTLSEGVKEMMLNALEEQGGDTDRDIEEIGREFVMQGRPTSLIQRPAQVDEVANMVGYVASPASSATNGAALRVDGGVVDSIV